MNYLLPERLDRLAREYALGTLAGRARRRFERVLSSSRAAAMAVDVWRDRLAVLDLGVLPMQPPASNWRAIEDRLFASATGAPTPAAAPARGLWQTLAGWFPRRAFGGTSARTWAGALAGALICLAVVRVQPDRVGLEPVTEAVSPSYIGVVFDPADQPVLVVSSRRDGRQLTMKLVRPIAVPAGQVAQLWAVPNGGGAPFPMGVLPTEGSAQSTLPGTSEALLANVSRIAISFEKSAARPGDAPSGRFALNGVCVKVW